MNSEKLTQIAGRSTHFFYFEYNFGSILFGPILAILNRHPE